MTINYTTLLGLAQPVTGTEANTWGTAVNDQLTALLDTAVAGTTTITPDADITLTDTTGAANEARQAIILWATASGTTTRNITAPARSKGYIVINKAVGAQSIVFRGAGPTTGVTIVQGEYAVIAWNGSDFVKVSNQNGLANFTTVDTTNIEVTNLKAKDGTSAGSIANSTGVVTLASVDINGGTLDSAVIGTSRINPRTSTAASTATLTPDISANDQYNLTAQAVGLTVAAPIGTPVDGNKLIFRILDNGTSQSITWNATYTVIGTVLPTVTTINKMLYVGCIYNSTNTRWDVVAVLTQA